MYHSEVGRCENRSMKSADLIIFFGTILGVHFIGIKLYQNHGFPMILGRICHNGLQHFMVNWAENHQADRLIDVNLPLIPPIWGVWPSIMTTIVDWVMTLGFFGKKAWEKKFMARFFRRKVMAFPDFFLSNFLRFRYWTFTRSGWDCPAQQLDQREGEFGGI